MEQGILKRLRIKFIAVNMGLALLVLVDGLDRVSRSKAAGETLNTDEENPPKRRKGALWGIILQFQRGRRSHIPGQGPALLVHQGAQPSGIAGVDEQVLYAGRGVQQHLSYIIGQAVALFQDDLKTVFFCHDYPSSLNVMADFIV